MTRKQKLQINSRAIAVLVVIVSCLTYPLGAVIVPVTLASYMGTSMSKELNETEHFQTYVEQNKFLVSICAAIMLGTVAMLLVLALFAKKQFTLVYYLIPLASFLPVVVFSEIEMFKKNGLHQ